MDIKTKQYYIDITEEFLKSATPNSHVVKKLYYFINKDKKYKVDGKNVVFDYSKSEKEIAIWLKETFGGPIFMVPRINFPEGIKTADYLWNGEYWDLKVIKSCGKRVIDNRVNGTKLQTTNYILLIQNNLFDLEQVNKQIEKIYESPDRNWVDKIMVIKDGRLFKVYKKADPQPKVAAEDQPQM